jgi:hypothetical protein
MKASDRRKAIAERSEDTGTKARLWCKATWKMFPILRVPLEALMLYVDNHRFQAERKLIESQLGHAIDPENQPDDEKAIIAILLDNALKVDGDRVVGKPTKEAEALRDDWLARKQETPFWIRPDGTVRNGNRRLAMLRRLTAEKGVAGHEFVDVVILDPKDVNERDLFDMEQREQLTENLKVRYTDINLLLTLKEAAEARKIDWTDPESIDKVATELQHVAKGNKAYAGIQLRAIKYMDLFLADAGKPGQYQDLLRQVERFRDIGNVMVHMEADYQDDAPDMLRLAFAAIRAGNQHEDIRALRKLFLDDRTKYKKLLTAITKDEEEWEKAAGNARLEEPKIVSRATDDDEEDEDEVPGPVVPNYPRDRVKTKISNAIDSHKAAQLNVSSILEQAYGRLEPLNAKKLKEALQGQGAAEIEDVLLKLVTWADEARGALPKRKSK